MNIVRKCKETKYFLFYNVVYLLVSFLSSFVFDLFRSNRSTRSVSYRLRPGSDLDRLLLRLEKRRFGGFVHLVHLPKKVKDGTVNQIVDSESTLDSFSRVSPVYLVEVEVIKFLLLHVLGTGGHIYDDVQTIF